MEVPNIVIVFVVILILALLFKDNKKGEEKYKTISGKKVNYYPDDNKYLWEYDWAFGGWPYWYNSYTPLPFNNPTRYHGYKTALYPLIHDYHYPRIRYY
jgi:hypothetical protein